MAKEGGTKRGICRRKSSGGMEWLGWRYGVEFFRALDFQFSEPDIWQKSALFLRNFRDFAANFGL